MSTGNLKELLGKRLKRVRKWRKLSQKELADMVEGLHKNTISDYENGRGNLSANRMEELARALEVESVTLLPVSGDAYKQGLKDARHMAETAWVEFKHAVSVELEKIPAEDPDTVDAPTGVKPTASSASPGEGETGS